MWAAKLPRLSLLSLVLSLCAALFLCLYVMYTVTSHAKPKDWAHPEICAPPFRMLVVGPSGTGKSCIISSLLSFKPYKEAFDENVFFFSPTMKHDEEYAHLKIKEENVFDHYDADAIADLYDLSKESKGVAEKGEGA